MKKAEREAERLNYIKILQNSWTYEKLTQKERINLTTNLIHCKLFGTNKNQVHEQLHAINLAFLMALNYEPIGWREPNKNEIPVF